MRHDNRVYTQDFMRISNTTLYGGKNIWCLRAEQTVALMGRSPANFYLLAVRGYGCPEFLMRYTVLNENFSFSRIAVRLSKTLVTG